MNLKHLIDRMPASLLYVSMVLSAHSFAATPDEEERASEQPFTTENPTREAHPDVAEEGECANAPNNVGQGAIENAQPVNPNAPAQLGGAQNEKNPAAQRNENPQVAQNEENCFGAHEDPATN